MVNSRHRVCRLRLHNQVLEMREEMANLVHPVLVQGLRLKERLQHGEDLNLMDEQSILKGLLQTDNQARRLADFGGERPVDVSGGNWARPAEGRRSPESFLGARYALVCWLDELFTLDSPWAARWNEQKLETELYASNQRAFKFWEQARKAEACPGTDALEVFYLCVMLGFRGDLRQAPERLQAWCSAVEARLAQGRGEWPSPPERKPETNVPPLRGRERMQRMILAGCLLLGVLIPVGVFLIVSQLGR
jgi:type VI secretion system protein ImpK